MQSSEALGVAAQVAVTLAGFAGIVVVFRPQSVHEWSALDRLRLSLLLMNSAMPLAFALFGMLLLCAEPTPASIWRWCSGVGFAAEIVVFVFMRNPQRRMSAADLQTVNKQIFYGIGVIVTIAIALQVVNFAVWNRFWPFFAVISCISLPGSSSLFGSSSCHRMHRAKLRTADAPRRKGWVCGSCNVVCSGR